VSGKRRPPTATPEWAFVPVTPAGTACTWLASPTADAAWDRLVTDAAHMPYKTREGFEARGYTVERWPAEAVGYW
jgi:hypothetical protein